MSWPLEPDPLLQHPYVYARPVASEAQDGPFMVAGFDMAGMDGSSFPPAGGYSSPLGGGYSSPGWGGGLFAPSGDTPEVLPLLIPDSDSVDPPSPPVVLTAENPVSIPEPGTLLLLGAGLAGLIWIGKRLER
jgi:hypothetical protein